MCCQPFNNCWLLPIEDTLPYLTVRSAGAGWSKVGTS
jgi:hypothetical protein